MERQNGHLIPEAATHANCSSARRADAREFGFGHGASNGVSEAAWVCRAPGCKVGGPTMAMLMMTTKPILVWCRGLRVIREAGAPRAWQIQMHPAQVGLVGTDQRMREHGTSNSK